MNKSFSLKSHLNVDDQNLIEYPEMNFFSKSSSFSGSFAKKSPKNDSVENGFLECSKPYTKLYYNNKASDNVLLHSSTNTINGESELKYFDLRKLPINKNSDTIELKEKNSCKIEKSFSDYAPSVQNDEFAIIKNISMCNSAKNLSEVTNGSPIKNSFYDEYNNKDTFVEGIVQKLSAVNENTRKEEVIDPRVKQKLREKKKIKFETSEVNNKLDRFSKNPQRTVACEKNEKTFLKEENEQLKFELSKILKKDKKFLNNCDVNLKSLLRAVVETKLKENESNNFSEYNVPVTDNKVIKNKVTQKVSPRNFSKKNHTDHSLEKKSLKRKSTNVSLNYLVKKQNKGIQTIPLQENINEFVKDPRLSFSSDKMKKNGLVKLKSIRSLIDNKKVDLKQKKSKIIENGVNEVKFIQSLKSLGMLDYKKNKIIEKNKKNKAEMTNEKSEELLTNNKLLQNKDDIDILSKLKGSEVTPCSKQTLKSLLFFSFEKESNIKKKEEFKSVLNDLNRKFEEKKKVNKIMHEKPTKCFNSGLSISSQSKLAYWDLENNKKQRRNSLTKEKKYFDKTNKTRPETLCPKLQRGISFDEALRDHQSKMSSSINDIGMVTFDKTQNEGDRNGIYEKNSNIVGNNYCNKVNYINQNFRVKEFYEEGEIDSGEIKLVTKKKKRMKKNLQKEQ